MAKRNSKRRPWTSGDVRELKSAARNKTPARKIARRLTQRGRYAPKGVQPRIVARLTRVTNNKLTGSVGSHPARDR